MNCLVSTPIDINYEQQFHGPVVYHHSLEVGYDEFLPV